MNCEFVEKDGKLVCKRKGCVKTLPLAMQNKNIVSKCMGKRQLPPPSKMVWNFAKAVARHIQDGGTKVSKEEYARRLEICDTCPLRQGNRCTHMNCGCRLDLKARWRSENCPVGKWENNE